MTEKLFRAGFGASCITPPLPCRLAGFARREGLSWQVAQQLWARSLVLDDGTCTIGWVVCDLLEVGRSLVADIRTAVSATGCLDGQDVMVSATHTHAGPDLNCEWAEGATEHAEAKAAYRNFLPHAIASSLVAAVSDLAPASLSWGKEAVYGVAASRRGGAGGPQKLGALIATQGARARGMRVIYPCHGTVLGPDNLLVSGDLIGVTVEALERTTGTVGGCSWAQGAAGDVSTRYTRRERTFAELQRLAQVVATGAQRAGGAARPLNADLGVRLERTTVALLLKSDDPVGTQHGVVPVAQRAPGDRSKAALLEEALVARAARRDGTFEAEGEAEICVLTIGELKLCFVPGEPFESIERALCQRSDLPDLRVVGYSNGAPGYIFTPEEEPEAGYEVMASPLTGAAGEGIVSAATRLLSRTRA